MRQTHVLLGATMLLVAAVSVLSSGNLPTVDTDPDDRFVMRPLEWGEPLEAMDWDTRQAVLAQLGSVGMFGVPIMVPEPVPADATKVGCWGWRPFITTTRVTTATDG